MGYLRSDYNSQWFLRVVLNVTLITYNQVLFVHGKRNRVYQVTKACKNSHFLFVFPFRYWKLSTRCCSCRLESTKYKNVLVNNKVALVIDDLKTINPWDPRGIRIYGIADTVDRQGGHMSNTDHPQSRYIRIRPTKKWSWGIDEPVFVQGKFNVKKSTANI